MVRIQSLDVIIICYAQGFSPKKVGIVNVPNTVNTVNNVGTDLHSMHVTDVI